MTDFRPYLLFPVRDAFARKQFLTACLIMLAGTFIPLIPLLILLGYSAGIMRQIIEQEQEPSMHEWQESNWGELLGEGARMLAVRLVYGLPILLLMGIGAISLFTGFSRLSPAPEGNTNPMLTFPGGIPVIVGIGSLLLAIILSQPLAVILGAAECHTVTKRSFKAGLRVAEWWPIFRNGFGFFLGVYAFTMVASFALSIVMQMAMVTIVLICLIPFVTFGFSTYLTLVMNALFANAYAKGRKSLQPA